MKRIGTLALLLIACAVVMPATAQTVPTSREQVQLSFSPVVKKAAPAVVNIYTKRIVRQASPLLADPFFRQFFGQMGVPQERVQSSLGSGVIVRADGLVITNHHVVKDANLIHVVLADRREFEAELLGSDERTDIAVLKLDLEGQSVPVLPIGDSDRLEVGDLVLAIGNPYGLGQTVSSGIVSAAARTQTGISDVNSFIQTDAAINPGNSGGALVDLDGQLVGINTAIFSQTGGSIGIGFAIPVSMVQAVTTAITNGGKVLRPWIGASGQGVSNEIAQSMQLARPAGVLIDSIYPGGPAEQAGLRLGDVVLAVNGHEVDDSGALRFRLATLPLGQTAMLTVSRRGQPVQLPIRLVAPPDDPPREITEVSGRNPFSGAVIANLNPALADELGVATSERGVILLRVKRGTIAGRLGLQPSDIVLRINDRPINTVAELRQAVTKGGEGWKLTIKREGEVQSILVGS